MEKLLMLSVLAFATPTHAASPAMINMDVPPDEAWTRTIQALALQGVTITNNDRDNGIIQGAGSFLGKPGLLTCPRANGVAESQEFLVNVVVRPEGAASSAIEVRVSGSERRYQNNKFLFITTGRERTTTECESTGAIELALRNALVGV